MNKTILVERVANLTGMSKAAVGRTVEAILDSISNALKKNDTVSLMGFGSFAVRKRAARMGHNPKTKAPIQIKAAKIPFFRPGSRLRQALA